MTSNISLIDFDDAWLGADAFVRRWQSEFEASLASSVVDINVAKLLRSLTPVQHEALRAQDPAMYDKLMQRIGGGNAK